MIMIGLSAVRTFQISSPHPIDQFEPNIRQSENHDTRDRGCDCRVHIHYENEVVNVNQLRKPLTRHEPGVDARVERYWGSYAIMRNLRYKPTSEQKH